MYARRKWANWFRWLTMRPRTTARRRSLDFADHGTAFGLDLSLTPPVTHEKKSTAAKKEQPDGPNRARP